MYYARFGIYAGIYLGLFLFAMLIRNIQRTQMQRHYQAEKKITELQLKIVRNQMDPHFAMNAITSVISAIGQNKTEEASQHLHSFAKLYRHLVLTADHITCKLSEELEFTENYIAMMQFRFVDKFLYEKNISPGIEADLTEIPKMLIQSQVENAIRHGLLPRQGGGLLSLDISRLDPLLKIAVTDNGVGRQRAHEAGEVSTGKGNQMVREFLALYQKITGRQVSYEVHDLYDETGQPAGTCVNIFIGLQNL
jgi:sensor histidine kinase YesM